MEDTDLLKKLYIQNPWWEGKNTTTPSIKRRDFYTLKKNLSDKHITALIGPRRVGKSVLIKQLIDNLISEKTQPKNILFIQLDEPAFENEKQKIIEQALEVYAKYILNHTFSELKEKVYVFLDEIQTIENWSKNLKSYYDKDYNIKFVVTGSSSAKITKGSSESLAGRINLHIILTLEFVDFTKFNEFEDESKISEVSLKIRTAVKEAITGEKTPASLYQTLNKHYFELVPKQEKIEQLLAKYLIQGGYVELIGQDYSKSVQYLHDLMQLVVYKDIVKTFEIRNPRNIEDLLLYLATHSAEEISENNLASELKMTARTISEYLNYLEDTFLINTCRIYATNKSKQLRNPKKAFISDCGVRNMLAGTFSPRLLADTRDLGLVVETVVRNHLLRLAFHFDWHNAKCYYWKKGKEIDNVIEYEKHAIPIEVKYQNEINTEDVKSCKAFIKEYKSPFAIIVTKNKFNFNEKEKIFYIPLWFFLIIF